MGATFVKNNGVFLICLLLLPGTAFAQPVPPPPTLDTLEVFYHAANVQGASGISGWHWVVDRDNGHFHINFNITNADLKQRLENFVRGENETSQPDWLLDGRSSLQRRIQDEFRIPTGQGTVIDLGFVGPTPTERNSALPHRKTFALRLLDAQITQYKIWVHTAGTMSESQPGVTVLRNEAQPGALSLMEQIAAEHGMTNLTDAEKRIVVVMEYLPDEFKNRNGQRLSLDQVQQQLRGIAWEAFVAGRAKNLFSGTGGADDSAATSQIDDAFVPPPRALVSRSTPGMLILEVAEVKPVQATRIDVEPTPLEKQITDRDVEPSPLKKKNTDGATTAKLEQKRKQFGTDLLNRTGAVLRLQPGHIYTSQEFSDAKVQDTGTLERQKGVVPQSVNIMPPKLWSDTPEIVYSLEKIPDLKEIALSGGAVYNPRERLAADLHFAGTNLLGLKETSALDFTVGAQVQKGALSFLYAPDHAPTAFAHTFSLTGKYYHLQDARFGETLQDTAQDRETGLEAKYALVSPTLNLAPKRQRPLTYQGNLQVGFAYRNVSLYGLPPVPGVPVDGPIAPLTVRMEHHLFDNPHDPGRRGMGSIGLHLASQWQEGFRAFGSPYRFDQLQSQLALDTTFGPVTSSDFLLRYVQGFGASLGRLPLYQLYRLGGAQNIRGLEEGERISRNISYNQIEFGASFAYLFNQRPKTGVQGQNGSGSGAPDLSQMYLKLFCDQARLTRSGFGSLLSPWGGLQGYGLALEVRGVSIGNTPTGLNFGYAYSPDSLRHKSGLFFAGLTLALQ